VARRWSIMVPLRSARSRPRAVPNSLVPHRDGTRRVLFEARAKEERGVAPEEQLKLAMTQSSKLVQPQQLANMIVFQAG
jgi:hypothetical protein